MKSESTDSSSTKRSCFYAPRFEGLVLQLYLFTMPCPDITHSGSGATDEFVPRFPIGFLACFALEQEKSLISIKLHSTRAHLSCLIKWRTQYRICLQELQVNNGCPGGRHSGQEQPQAVDRACFLQFSQISDMLEFDWRESRRAPEESSELHLGFALSARLTAL